MEKARKTLKVWIDGTFYILLCFFCIIFAEILIYNTMQDHEQALSDAIARLAEISDGESGKSIK